VSSGVVHWHGAFEESNMTSIFIVTNAKHRIAELKQSVTDEEYKLNWLLSNTSRSLSNRPFSHQNRRLQKFGESDIGAACNFNLFS
jgi:hypothetical protein